MGLCTSCFIYPYYCDDIGRAFDPAVQALVQVLLRAGLADVFLLALQKCSGRSRSSLVALANLFNDVADRSKEPCGLGAAFAQNSQACSALLEASSAQMLNLRHERCHDKWSLNEWHRRNVQVSSHHRLRCKQAFCAQLIETEASSCGVQYLLGHLNLTILSTVTCSELCPIQALSCLFDDAAWAAGMYHQSQSPCQRR